MDMPVDHDSALALGRALPASERVVVLGRRHEVLSCRPRQHVDHISWTAVAKRCLARVQIAPVSVQMRRPDPPARGLARGLAQGRRVPRVPARHAFHPQLCRRHHTGSRASHTPRSALFSLLSLVSSLPDLI
eukprot:scaffold184049_cov32-Tisochrysis_lutea.AAC.3